ncbi:MAG: HAMP domain-containing protein [Spirochaetia bacterium]|nr:HAMP domain-containing protein [Spirochaetia bacterium]
MNKKWTIKKKLLISTSILIFISVMIVTIISSRNYKKDMIELSYSDTKTTLTQLANNVETYLQGVQELCIIPYYDTSLIEALSMKTDSPSQILKRQRIIEAFLTKNILLPHDDIQDAYIYTDEELFSSNRDDNYVSSSGLSKEMINKVQNSKIPIIIYSNNDDFEFIVLSNILDLEDNSKSIGILRIDANSKGLDNVCSNVIDALNKALIITNENNQVIYAKSKSYSFDFIKKLYNQINNKEFKNNIISVDSEEFLITDVKIPITSWTIYDISSIKVMTKNINQIQFRSILLGLLCATIGILLSTQLVKRLLKPIYDVTDLMKKVQKEDYSVKANVNGDDEIAYLASSFNEMTERIDVTMKKNIQLTKEVYEAKYLEKEAQYVAMCNQIKPHFLFNSLNTISLLIKVNRVDESIDYIEKLASLLNALVHADSQITLRSEILICKNYLSMQCIRYTNLKYDISIEEKHLNYLIPALTIQPIIENALIHGFSRKEDLCLIKIYSKEKENKILIYVEDNGLGINKEKLLQLKDKINNPESALDSNIKRVALINISRRIKLKYGNDFGLDILSKENEGATFILTIPKTVGDENNV